MSHDWSLGIFFKENRRESRGWKTLSSTVVVMNMLCVFVITISGVVVTKRRKSGCVIEYT